MDRSLTLLRSKPELERLDLTHSMITIGTGDKLFHSPIEESKVHRILDVGTGTGLCMFSTVKYVCTLRPANLSHPGAITIADQYPGAEV